MHVSKYSNLFKDVCESDRCCQTLYSISHSAFGEGVFLTSSICYEAINLKREQSSRHSQRLDQLRVGIWVLSERERHFVISFYPLLPTHDQLTS